jgi:TonB family protein
MSRPILSVVVLLLILAAAPAGAQQDFAAAKELYAAARYEESLAVLDQLKEAKPASPEAALGVEQYRAMCLLALNRKAEAEQAIETIADLDPFYQPAEDDAAPWIRAAFRETRRKVLPAALQRLYAHAKDAYNRKNMAEAVVAFGRVLKILDDPDLMLDKAAQGDMKMVAQGFIDLAQAATTPPRPAAPPTAQPTAPPPPSPPAGSAANGASAPGARPAGSGPATDGPPVYDASSQDVTPPLPIRRDVPISTAGPRALPGAAVVVEIVVRENGTIDSAVVRQSAGKYYDDMVAQAARSWLYRPAAKAGQPVRYRLLVKVVIGREPEPAGPTR